MGSRNSGRTIHSEARNIVSRVIKKCDEEAKQGQLIHLLRQSTKRASDYAGVSEKTITRIRKESIESGGRQLSSPGKKRPRRPEKKFHCSEENRTIIRNIIYEFYVENETVPPAEKLLDAIRERIDFPWRTDTLYKLLKNMGFKYVYSNSRNKILIEKPSIVTWRSKYLKAVQYYRTLNKNIIYVGEMWVDNSLHFSKCWRTEEFLGVLQNKSSHRLVIVHAGGKDGFLNSAGLFFKSPTTNGDYYGQMNAVNFEKWIREKLLPNVPPNSVIVMEDIPYHGVESNKPPSKYSTRKDMIQWLAGNNVPYTKTMRRHELSTLVQQHKKSEKTYQIDELIKLHGHEALRLPPHMCVLNPIELAWAEVKQKIRENNTTSTLSIGDLEILVKQVIQEVTPVGWENFCAHVEKIEQEYWKKDGLLEDVMDNLTMKLQSSGSDDSDESDDSTSSEDL